MEHRVDAVRIAIDRRATGPTRLPAPAVESLQRVWARAAVRGPSGVSRDELLRTARVVSHAAREAGLLAEQVICSVKESWRAYGGFATAALRHDAQPLLAELVTLCIAEFYATDGAMTDGPVSG